MLQRHSVYAEGVIFCKFNTVQQTARHEGGSTHNIIDRLVRIAQHASVTNDVRARCERIDEDHITEVGQHVQRLEDNVRIFAKNPSDS